MGGAAKLLGAQTSKVSPTISPTPSATPTPTPTISGGPPPDPNAVVIGFVNSQQIVSTFSAAVGAQMQVCFGTNNNNCIIYTTYYFPVEDVLPKNGLVAEAANPNTLFAIQYLANGFCERGFYLDGYTGYTGGQIQDHRTYQVLSVGMNTSQAASLATASEAAAFYDRLASRLYGYTDTDERALIQDFVLQSKADFSTKYDLYMAVCIMMLSSVSGVVN
jgi:hypothetical protein